MVGANVVVAKTDQEARRLFTTIQQQFAHLQRGDPGRLRPPIDDIEAYWSPHEKIRAQHMLACSFVGAPETVREGLARFLERTGADEVMVAAPLYDQEARRTSYRMLAEIAATLNGAAS
jgi:alkanesulfonate monooxygenase SsuD/methylene tetrahydromethanopterin reductase-like flavin-dependent oxidoreductase (luciferase family)